MGRFPLPLTLRPAIEADRAFLVDDWVNPMRHAPSSRGVPGPLFYRDQRRVIADLLDVAETVVACAAEDVAHIFGYAVFDRPNVLHWIATKDAYRRMGLFDVLLDAAFPQRVGEPIYMTHAGPMLMRDLEPTYSREDHERFRRSGKMPPPGALTRRNIFYRPHLLIPPLPRAV